MKLTHKKAIAAAIAGITGTIAFDLSGLIVMGHWWNVPHLLADKIGIGLPGGVFLHYGNGILLAIIFAGLIPLFIGPIWSRALQYITLQTIFGIWFFMFPLLDMGAMGLQAGTLMPLMTLITHWTYGLIVGLTYPILAERVESELYFADAR
jgi:hypothetical protein